MRVCWCCNLSPLFLLILRLGTSYLLLPQADGWASDHFKVKINHLYDDDDKYRKV